MLPFISHWRHTKWSGMWMATIFFLSGINGTAYNRIWEFLSWILDSKVVSGWKSSHLHYYHPAVYKYWLAVINVRIIMDELKVRRSWGNQLVLLLICWNSCRVKHVEHKVREVNWNDGGGKEGLGCQSSLAHHVNLKECQSNFICGDCCRCCSWLNSWMLFYWVTTLPLLFSPFSFPLDDTAEVTFKFQPFSSLRAWLKEWMTDKSSRGDR